MVSKVEGKLSFREEENRSSYRNSKHHELSELSELWQEAPGAVKPGKAMVGSRSFVAIAVSVEIF